MPGVVFYYDAENHSSLQGAKRRRILQHRFSPVRMAIVGVRVLRSFAALRMTLAFVMAQKMNRFVVGRGFD